MIGLGSTYTPGTLPVVPGVYINVALLGEAKQEVVEGIVGVLFAASGGPMVPTWVDGVQQASALYGTAVGVEAVKEALRGGARRVRALRVGTGGTLGTKTLNDGAAVPTVRVDLAYPGTRAYGYTVGDNVLEPATRRDLILYENTADGYVKRQTITFNKGAAGIGEPQALVAAVAAANASAAPESKYVTATFLADGGKVLAAVTTITAFTAGTNPTVNAGAYDTAQDVMASESWNVLTLDSEDTAIHAAAAQFVADLETSGVRRFLVLGEPTSVAFDTRRAHASAFNKWNIVYQLNGFTDSAGVAVEGFKSAARQAGLVAGASFRRSTLGAPVAGARDLVGALSQETWRLAVTSGAAAFVRDPAGAVVDGYGVTSYTTLDGAHSASWRKILAVARMYYALDLVALTWWSRVVSADGIPNTDSGRATLTGDALGVFRDLEKQEMLQVGSKAYLDPSNPPTTDSATWIFELSVADNVEKLLATARFA